MKAHLHTTQLHGVCNVLWKYKPRKHSQRRSYGVRTLNRVVDAGQSQLQRPVLDNSLRISAVQEQHMHSTPSSRYHGEACVASKRFQEKENTPGEAAAARAVSSFCSASQHRRTTRSEPSSASSSRVIAAASCSAFAVSTRASAASSSAEDAAIPLCAAERVPEALVKRSATRQKSAQTNWTEILRCLHPFELETSTNVTAERTATHGQPASVSLSGVVSFFKGLKLGGGKKKISSDFALTIVAFRSLHSRLLTILQSSNVRHCERCSNRAA